MAAFLTFMAKIAQRVRGLGFWEPEVFQWSMRQFRCAGGRQTRWCDRFVRDLDLGAFNQLDARRIEVIVDGLSFWHGAKLAVDAIVVSPLHADGSARRIAATSSGVVLQASTQSKGDHVLWTLWWGRRPRLLVMAAEVGGRWSQETADFLNAMAKAKAEEHPRILQGRVRDACVRRWSALLACCLARSLAVSLLERRPVPGTGGDVPSVHEVVEGRQIWVGCTSGLFLWRCVWVVFQQCLEKKKEKKKKRPEKKKKIRDERREERRQDKKRDKMRERERWRKDDFFWSDNETRQWISPACFEKKNSFPDELFLHFFFKSSESGFYFISLDSIEFKISGHRNWFRGGFRAHGNSHFKREISLEEKGTERGPFPSKWRFSGIRF